MRSFVSSKFLALLASVTALSLAGVFVVIWFLSPSDGARLQPGQQPWQANGIVVTPLFDDPKGLQAGDVVTAVNGQEVESLVRSLFQPGTRRPIWQVGQVVRYTILRGGQQLDLEITLKKSSIGPILKQNWGSILAAVINMLLAAFVYIRRPNNPRARILFLIGSSLLGATTWSFGLQISDLVQGANFWTYQLTTNLAYMLLWISILHFALVFPQPQKIIQQRTWIIPFLYIIPFTVHLIYVPLVRAYSANTLDWLSRASSDVGFIQAIYMSLTLIAAITSFRAARDSVSRLQVRWLMYALILVAVLNLGLGMFPEIIFNHSILSWDNLALIGLLVPGAVTIAILRFHLFDIDVLIRRTLIYGTLTVIVAAIYVLIVSVSDALFFPKGAAQSVDNLPLSFLAAALIAVLFQPLRDRLQSWINRRMYGDRDDPYTALTTLGNSLQSTLDPESVMPAIVETVAQSMRLPYAAIELKQGEEFNLMAEFGLKPASNHQNANCQVFPLIYQSEIVGQLILAQRSPDETFNPADQKLIATIAGQAGVAAHAVRLAIDLQRSRERLVTTREEERRRLRRDLHDGLGSVLASLSFNLDAASNMLLRDPEATRTLLKELKIQTQVAMRHIRQMAYELRPPVLDEWGLAASLRDFIEKSNCPPGFDIKMNIPEVLPILSAAVEIAAYRISVEGINNMLRHSQARNGAVVILNKIPGSLSIEIKDDGQGLPDGWHAGVGITAMRERAAELGGTFMIDSSPERGTKISVTLPLSRE